MEEADYIIVGAGSAGCVLADRLSADGRFSVVVLEAGGSDRHLWVRIPIGYGKAFYHDGLNWKYKTEPVPGTDGQPAYWPRGKVLGGSSSINAMVFIRGQAEDYDGWRDLGNPGWGFQDLLPHFKQMEDNLAGADALRGQGGPLTVTSTAHQVHPLCNAFLAAGKEAGLAMNPDFNGVRQNGLGIYQLTTRGGYRCSAATAFLHPAMRRKNLRVLTKARVLQVLFDGRKATGIRLHRRGKATALKARREVILAAGAVNSPQLLQLSGIGPGALLRAHGIEVLLDSPEVGQNLQDHIGYDLYYEATQPTLNDVLRSWRGRAESVLRYLLRCDGPLSLSVNQAGGFVHSDATRNRPNLQLYFSPLSYTTVPQGTRPMMQPDPFSGFLLGASNCHPRSRGTIALAAADPWAVPKIQPNYLTDREDLSELVASARILRRIAAGKAMKAIIRRQVKPGSEVEDETILTQYVRENAKTIYHPCGTCAMGPGPARAVVDPRLKVHGLEGLRVIDASIMPLIPSGNINAPSMMIGHKGASLILEDAA
ncbi:MAG: GMC family oxidoreductase N-terminal domain-containing protein [Rhodospirillales bacterium]|nr:GMC family oxidoreductase N-terminal domain-containing protein [Rhodospirillales bacterium]